MERSGSEIFQKFQLSGLEDPDQGYDSGILEEVMELSLIYKHSIELGDNSFQEVNEKKMPKELKSLFQFFYHKMKKNSTL